MIYGYARVSTDGQTLDIQLEELRTAGAEIMYQEKVSGAVTDRKELGRLLDKLTSGDVLLVTRLDRLARSTRDLLNILDRVTKADAGFRSLGDSWADTTTAQGRLVTTIMAGFAEFERSLIQSRTSEGITRARTRGVKFGRPPRLTHHQRLEALARKEAQEPVREIARSYNVSASTISRLRR